MRQLTVADAGPPTYRRSYRRTVVTRLAPLNVCLILPAFLSTAGHFAWRQTVGVWASTLNNKPASPTRRRSPEKHNVLASIPLRFVAARAVLVERCHTTLALIVCLVTCSVWTVMGGRQALLHNVSGRYRLPYNVLRRTRATQFLTLFSTLPLTPAMWYALYL